jgi:hypothetical protein
VRKLALAALAALVTSSAGAARSHLSSLRPAAAPHVRWTADDSAVLDAQVEALEERLLAHQARVAFWQELRTRHEDVAAVACANLGEHAAAMRQAETRSQLRLAEGKSRRAPADELQ